MKKFIYCVLAGCSLLSFAAYSQEKAEDSLKKLAVHVVKSENEFEEKANFVEQYAEKQKIGYAQVSVKKSDPDAALVIMALANYAESLRSTTTVAHTKAETANTIKTTNKTSSLLKFSQLELSAESSIISVSTKKNNKLVEEIFQSKILLSKNGVKICTLTFTQRNDNTTLKIKTDLTSSQLIALLKNNNVKTSIFAYFEDKEEKKALILFKYSSQNK